MRWLLDAAYLLAAIITAPIWITRMIATGKWRTDWPARFGAVPATRPDRAAKPGQHTILIHAVSVGEVNATRHLVRHLVADPRQPRVIIATTTDTGFARARALLGDAHDIVRFPFDFSLSVDRFLDRVKPDAVVLVELEVWPNFTARCAARGIPVCVVNGRISARSFARYAKVKWLVRRSFARLAFAAAQQQDYADRFRAMGVAPDRVHVTDTMKWDTAQVAMEVPGTAALAEALGIDRSRPLIVAGSTEPCEHALLHRAAPSGVQLLCAPRKPEWFDAAANDLPGCARRSRGDRGSAADRFLLDTIGELRAAYALADVVVVGRSFGELHGSDMMEPVALGKATIVGPRVDDFADSAAALLDAGGLIQTTADQLPAVLRSLLDDAPRRAELGRRGRDVIVSRQGASARHAKMILDLLDHPPASSRIASA
jgi:3-deoxy-D-manno-octulosonic-acid transferase